MCPRRGELAVGLQANVLAEGGFEPGFEPSSAKGQEVKAWNRRRNREKARINWLFTLEQARKRLGRTYPMVRSTANRAASTGTFTGA